VARVGLGDRRRAVGHLGTDEQTQSIGAAQPGGIESEVDGERLVEDKQTRVRRGFGVPADRQLR
jgi:hypothetical protein